MEQQELKAEDARLLHKGKTLINAPAKILEFLHCGKVIVLLLDSHELLSEQNILGYDSDGKF